LNALDIESGGTLFGLDLAPDWMPRFETGVASTELMFGPAEGPLEHAVEAASPDTKFAEQARCVARGIGAFHRETGQHPQSVYMRIIAMQCGLLEIDDMNFKIRVWSYNDLDVMAKVAVTNVDSLLGPQQLGPFSEWTERLEPTVAGSWHGVHGNRLVLVTVGVDPETRSVQPIVGAMPIGGHGDVSEKTFHIQLPHDDGWISADASRGEWGARRCNVADSEPATDGAGVVIVVTCPWDQRDDLLLVRLDVRVDRPEDDEREDDRYYNFAYDYALYRNEPDPGKLLVSTENLCSVVPEPRSLTADEFGDAWSTVRSTQGNPPVQVLHEQSEVNELRASLSTSNRATRTLLNRAQDLAQSGHLVPWRIGNSFNFLVTTQTLNPCHELMNIFRLRPDLRDHQVLAPSAGFAFGAAGASTRTIYSISFFTEVTQTLIDRMEVNFFERLNERRLDEDLERLEGVPGNLYAMLGTVAEIVARGNRTRGTVLREAADNAGRSLRRGIGTHIIYAGPGNIVHVPDYLVERDYIVVPRGAIVNNPDNNSSTYCLLLFFLNR
jgi:hypothetical protein